MNRIYALTLVLVLVSLACGAPAIVPPDPENYVAPYLVSTTAIPFRPEPTPELTTLVAMTDTHVRECASVACDQVGVILEGETVEAFCEGDWCFSQDARGWFCQAALIGTGGCE